MKRLAVIATLLALALTIVVVQAYGPPSWCYVDIEQASTSELSLTVVSWSTSSEGARYWIDINYAAEDCGPWRVEGALPVVYNEVLESGPYNVKWADYFAVTRPSDFPPKAGYEACINWACRTPEDTLSRGTGYELIWGHTFLPVVLSERDLPPRPTLTPGPKPTPEP